MLTLFHRRTKPPACGLIGGPPGGATPRKQSSSRSKVPYSLIKASQRIVNTPRSASDTHNKSVPTCQIYSSTRHKVSRTLLKAETSCSTPTGLPSTTPIDHSLRTLELCHWGRHPSLDERDDLLLLLRGNANLLHQHRHEHLKLAQSDTLAKTPLNALQST